jgi:hypothetical protein
MSKMDDPALVFTSLFYDEAHVYGRYHSSNTVSMMRKLNGRSDFRVLISGTPFPRGPRQDAKGYLYAMNGELSHAPKSWSRPMARSLRRLLDSEDFEYNTLVLRMILMPLTLKRTSRSTWEGDYIVTRRVACPKPTMIRPSMEDDIQERAKRLFQKEKHKDENMIKKMERADYQRYFAWSPIWLDVMKARKDEPAKGKIGTKVRLMEQIIASSLEKYEPTSRLLELASLVKALKASGQRFIIVSDRLFLIVLIHFVRSTCEFIANYRYVDGVYGLQSVSSVGQRSGDRSQLHVREIELFVY